MITRAGRSSIGSLSPFGARVRGHGRPRPRSLTFDLAFVRPFYEQGGIRAYYKVVKAGRGGPDGQFDPSILRNRYGAAPIGTRVYEYPQSNLYLAPRLEGGVLAGMSAPTTLTTGPLAGRTIAFPSWAAGVSLGAAWDFSGAVGSPEWRTMAEVHALAGATSSARVGLLLIDWPSIEKGVYVGPRLKAFASLALAWGWVWASVNERTSASIDDTGATVRIGGDYAKGRMIGVSGTLGLEYMIHPDRLLRLDVSWRAHGAVELRQRRDVGARATRRSLQRAARAPRTRDRAIDQTRTRDAT